MPMFQSLSDKLANAFKKFKSKGKLTESDIKEGMHLKIPKLQLKKRSRLHCLRRTLTSK